MKHRYKPLHVRRKIAIQNAFKTVLFFVFLWGACEGVLVLGGYKKRQKQIMLQMQQTEKSIKASEDKIRKLREIKPQ